MACESVWIVTWLPLTTCVVGRKRKTLSPEHKEFDDLTKAVNFVMGLDESLQATATIRLPGDDAIGLAIIKKMYAAQRRSDLIGLSGNAEGSSGALIKLFSPAGPTRPGHGGSPLRAAKRTRSQRN